MDARLRNDTQANGYANSRAVRLITPPPIAERSIVMSVYVCLCVCLPACLSAIISLELHVRSSPSFLCMLPMAVARSTSGDMLCTSGFMDDIIFAHKPRLLDAAAQLKRSAHAALDLAINGAQ